MTKVAWGPCLFVILVSAFFAATHSYADGDRRASGKQKPTPREIQERIERLNANRDRQGHVSLVLTNDAGKTANFLLFDKSWVQRYTAEKIKEGLRKKNPHFDGGAGAGFTIAVERIELAEVSADTPSVRPVLRGGGLALMSDTPLSKAELLSGRPIALRFEKMHHIGASDTDLTLATWFQLRYDPERRRFEILNGNASFTVAAPGGLTDSDTATFEPLFSEGLR